MIAHHTTLSFSGTYQKVLFFFAVGFSLLGCESRIYSEPAERLLFEEKSPYSVVSVKQRGNHRVLYLGQKEQSIFNPRQPDELRYTYTRLVISALANWPKGRPARVLMVGLGGGTLATYLYKYRPEFSLEVVELDPIVYKAARLYFQLPKSVRVYIADGRAFLTKIPQQYDIIILDAYNETYIPPALLSKEFIQITASRLKPSGMLVVNTWQSDKLSSHETATYLSVFPSLYDFRYPGWRSGNRILLTGHQIPAESHVRQTVKGFINSQNNEAVFPSTIPAQIQYIHRRSKDVQGQIITDKNVRQILGY